MGHEELRYNVFRRRACPTCNNGVNSNAYLLVHAGFSRGGWSSSASAGLSQRMICTLFFWGRWRGTEPEWVYSVSKLLGRSCANEHLAHLRYDNVVPCCGFHAARVCSSILILSEGENGQMDDPHAECFLQHSVAQYPLSAR